MHEHGLVAEATSQAKVLFVARDYVNVRQHLVDAAVFLAEHPLQWVPTWYGLVDRQARTEFWRAIAQLTLGALRAVAGHLDRERPLEMAG